MHSPSSNIDIFDYAKTIGLPPNQVEDFILDGIYAVFESHSRNSSYWHAEKIKDVSNKISSMTLIYGDPNKKSINYTVVRKTTSPISYCVQICVFDYKERSNLMQPYYGPVLVQMDYFDFDSLNALINFVGEATPKDIIEEYAALNIYYDPETEQNTIPPENEPKLLVLKNKLQLLAGMSHV
jgi:hypothetical protein